MTLFCSRECAARGVVGSLPGPSRRITVEPIRRPAKTPTPVPVRQPRTEPAPGRKPEPVTR